MLLLNCLVQESISQRATWHPRLQPFEVHHLTMLRIVIAHREQDLQEVLLALQWKVRTHREATVVEPFCGRQDGVLVGIDRAVLRPGLPVEIDQGTGIGCTSSEALKSLEFTADVVTVLADHEIKAPYLDVPPRLQAMALQQSERDERGLGRVFGPTATVLPRKSSMVLMPPCSCVIRYDTRSQSASR